MAQSALITGGAKRIGQDMALSLAKNGWNIGLHYRNSETEAEFTRKRIESLGIKGDGKFIIYVKPFGFIDYNYLQLNSFCSISDSGTISEESAILGFPAVTFRQSIERPEALDTGSISLTGLGVDDFLEAINIATSSRRELSGSPIEIPEAYQTRNVSERVLKLITGTAKLTKKWLNMDEFSRYDWEE